MLSSLFRISSPAEVLRFVVATISCTERVADASSSFRSLTIIPVDVSVILDYLLLEYLNILHVAFYLVAFRSFIY